MARPSRTKPTASRTSAAAPGTGSTAVTAKGLLVDQQGEGDRGEREHDTRDHREAIEVLLDHR